MEPKKSKYDTNPLDPDFVRNAGADPGDSGPETQEVSGATREIGSSGNENARNSEWFNLTRPQLHTQPLPTTRRARKYERHERRVVDQPNQL